MGEYPRSKSGNYYIFIVVDHFTKFTFLKAKREAATNNVIQFLIQEIFHKFHALDINSDNGSQLFKNNRKNIVYMKPAVYSPQANAAEGVNQSVLAAIRAYLEEIECALRTSVHSATVVTSLQ